jgi:hypothetical protein
MRIGERSLGEMSGTTVLEVSMLTSFLACAAVGGQLDALGMVGGNRRLESRREHDSND